MPSWTIGVSDGVAGTGEAGGPLDDGSDRATSSQVPIAAIPTIATPIAAEKAPSQPPEMPNLISVSINAAPRSVSIASWTSESL